MGQGFRKGNAAAVMFECEWILGFSWNGNSLQNTDFSYRGGETLGRVCHKCHFKSSGYACCTLGKFLTKPESRADSPNGKRHARKQIV